MQLKVQTTLSSSSEISQAQKELDNIINNRPLFCALFSVQLNKKYPQYWLREILPFLPIPKDLNPFVYRDTLYANLALSEDYLVTYKVLLVELERTLEYWYSRGYITGGEEISKSWRLEVVYLKDPFEAEDQNVSLYRPLWEDKRFAPQAVEFLLSRIQGEKSIVFSLLPSFPVLHAIALRLGEEGVNFSFVLGEEGWQPPRLISKVENLEEAFFLADLIEEASFNVIGSVGLKFFASKEEAERERTPSSVVYTTLGELEPYVLSTLKNFTL